MKIDLVNQVYNSTECLLDSTALGIAFGNTGALAGMFKASYANGVSVDNILGDYRSVLNLYSGNNYADFGAYDNANSIYTYLHASPNNAGFEMYHSNAVTSKVARILMSTDGNTNGFTWDDNANNTRVRFYFNNMNNYVLEAADIAYGYGKLNVQPSGASYNVILGMQRSSDGKENDLSMGENYGIQLNCKIGKVQINNDETSGGGIELKNNYDGNILLENAHASGKIVLTAGDNVTCNKDIEIIDTDYGIVMTARTGTKKFRIYIEDDTGGIVAEEV